MNTKLMRAACALVTALCATALAEDKFVQIQGAACSPPPVLHCPAADCPTAVIINQGQVVEMKTRRTYFLDYPCDLKPGEKVTLILSLHGGGSYGNWQRHYFPLMDYKDQYRLVVATPNSPVRAWSEADDEYLRNIVDFLVAQLGKENIKAFWLVGHSQGGMTSNRLVRTDYFKARVDGVLSLSGGRIGGNPGRAANFAAGRPAAAPASPTPSALTPSGLASAMAALRQDPDVDMSFIYSTGRRELDEQGLPETSTWAAKYACGARSKRIETTDTRPGYVYDGSRLNTLNPAWGLLPAGGKGEIFEFPNCKEGRVVADVQRLDKGHTEGYEPKITEEIIKLMLSARGGKLQALK